MNKNILGIMNDMACLCIRPNIKSRLSASPNLGWWYMFLGDLVVENIYWTILKLNCLFIYNKTIEIARSKVGKNQGHSG